MATYMDETHPDAFLDYPPVSAMAEQFDHYHQFEKENRKACPRCSGRGGWNLLINAYPLREGMADTPENRHKHVHFRASCSQCNGWGFVTRQQDVDCVHVWDRGTNIGRCLTLYKCTRCPEAREVDSSD